MLNKPKADWASLQLKSMTLEQKVGQLICARGLQFADSIEKMLERGWLGAIGAIAIRKTAAGDPREMVRLMQEYQTLSPYPVFYFTDAGQGLYDALGVGTSFPSQMAIGATGDADLAYRTGRAIAKEARQLHFTMLGSPVLDVNSNRDNPIIGTRAFGEEAAAVARLGIAYMKGIQDEKVVALGKHFPGHGDTEMDSHAGLPTVARTCEQLHELELVTFRQAIEAGMLGMMTAHIHYPHLQPSKERGVPATFSRAIISDLLQDQLGFAGMIVSDSLTMRAIKNNYTIQEAAVRAVQAGHHMILQDYESDPLETHRALMEAVRAGEISEEDVERKVLRLLQMKVWSQLPQLGAVSEWSSFEWSGAEEHRMLSQTVARRSITLLKRGYQPLSGQGNKLLVVLANTTGPSVSRDLGQLLFAKSQKLLEAFNQHGGEHRLLEIGLADDEDKLEELLQIAREVDEIHIASFIRMVPYQTSSGKLPSSQIEVVRRLHECGKPLSLILFGNPYVIAKMPEPDNLLCAYSDCDSSLEAAAEVLYGRIPAVGKLPVTLNDRFCRGMGKAQSVESISHYRFMKLIQLLKMANTPFKAKLRQALNGVWLAVGQTLRAFWDARYEQAALAHHK